jgi:type II secretory pathway pseudopilin PulG
MHARPMRDASRRSDDGFSLVEAIVALGLLAGVIVSTAGLIVGVRRQVASAGRASRALAAASSIVERLESRGFAGVPVSLGCDVRRPACTAHPGPGATSWLGVVLQEGPPGALAEVRLESLENSALETATSMRVSVVVHWSEGARRRSVRLVTVRT